MSYDIVITSTEMGAGDTPLTVNLMNGFIHTVAEKEVKPEHIILYGTGVNLAIKGSDALEDLQQLAAAGVNILSCGICLDYYEITDKLQVGEVTTMKSVVDILSESKNIVKP